MVKERSRPGEWEADTVIYSFMQAARTGLLAECDSRCSRN